MQLGRAVPVNWHRLTLRQACCEVLCVCSRCPQGVGYYPASGLDRLTLSGGFSLEHVGWVGLVPISPPTNYAACTLWAFPGLVGRDLPTRSTARTLERSRHARGQRAVPCRPLFSTLQLRRGLEETWTFSTGVNPCAPCHPPVSAREDLVQKSPKSRRSGAGTAPRWMPAMRSGGKWHASFSTGTQRVAAR